MKDLTQLSPVAKVNYLERQLEIYGKTIDKLGEQIMKLRSEVTGGMQIIWLLAKKNGGKLTLPTVDLITAMGAVKRSYDAESDTYTFEALDPTERQLVTLENTLNAPPTIIPSSTSA